MRNLFKRNAQAALKRATDADEEFDGLLADNDLKTLKATLQDLLECKRLLDQTRQD